MIDKSFHKLIAILHVHVHVDMCIVVVDIVSIVIALPKVVAIER